MQRANSAQIVMLYVGYISCELELNLKKQTPRFAHERVNILIFPMSELCHGIATVRHGWLYLSFQSCSRLLHGIDASYGLVNFKSIHGVSANKTRPINLLHNVIIETSEFVAELTFYDALSASK